MGTPFCSIMSTFLNSRFTANIAPVVFKEHGAGNFYFDPFIIRGFQFVAFPRETREWIETAIPALPVLPIQVPYPFNEFSHDLFLEDVQKNVSEKTCCPNIVHSVVSVERYPVILAQGLKFAVRDVDEVRGR